MKPLSDATLMAYHDGALSPAEARAVEAALAEDPTARERLHVLAEIDALVGRAFATPLHQPVPESLLGAIDDGPAPNTAAPAGRARRRAMASRVARNGALPLAASLMLLVGLAGGYGLSRLVPARDAADGFVSTAGLDRHVENALESAASGRVLRWQSSDRQAEGHVRLVLTFVDGAGRFCREYELLDKGPQGEQATVGVACRGESGGWRNEVVVAAHAQPTGAFLPASGSSGAALEAAIATLMVDEPLSAEREQRLIDRRWRP